MISFNGIVRISLHNVTRQRQQLIEYPRIGRRPISVDLGRTWTVSEGVGKELASGRQIPLLGDQHVDDLPILVNRPIQIYPATGDFDISLVDIPPITRRVPTGPGRINQQRGKPLHPPIDSDMSQDTFIHHEMTWQDGVWAAVFGASAPLSRSELCFAVRWEGGSCLRARVGDVAGCGVYPAPRGRGGSLPG
jgi:hypothetical protein